MRAYALEGLSAAEAAQRFGFKEKSLYALAHDLRAGKLNFFPPPSPCPKDRHVTPYVRDQIGEWRKSHLSVDDIVERLRQENLELSPSTVERILKDSGFGKLARRTAAQRGRTKNNALLAQPAHNLEFGGLEPFNEECQVAGIFAFLPYILESGILDVVEELPLPQSEVIGKTQAFLSFLALKLMGGERLCHVRQYDHDVGFGVFAGLNALPKPTYMETYSCRLSADLCQRLQKEIMHRLTAGEPALFSGQTITLDFHSIPHFGDQSEMEKVWRQARRKAMKGANTFFAQDAETRVLLYANADALRQDGSQEILHFVDYWKDIKGVIQETLVFDSRLTTYKILGQLDEAKVKFITLRTRGKSLAEQTEALPDSGWQKVKLPIPKRKHQTFLVHESEAALKGCSNTFRQIIMKDHGRAEPTYVITNHRDMELVEILSVYARRRRIENKLAELVNFFHLNALSSPIMIRIFFDLLLSVMASLLYRRFAQDLPRFEKKLAPDLFRRFVDMPGRVLFDGQNFEVRIRKRAHTSILLGVKKLQEPIAVPWLEGRTLKIIFTA
ncbi:MAG: transposase [Candidatus Omnitrophota bacterium]